MEIRQLPEALSNKIAAGEVVERPASVVKELIENSIDAKSSWIRVDLQEAGLASIRVSDDGTGMDEENVKRAFLRHATSKIKYDTDLFHIKSLGFRGEALASISSVSKLTIKTSTGDQAGTALYLEGGEIKNFSKTDARKGTEIKVEQLFYNTPARLKYMKTIHTELGHITDLLNRYALARPEIRFEVTHNHKTVFKTSGNGKLNQVIANIYGLNVAKNMIQLETSDRDFSISGYIARPEITRASNNYMTFIVNGRYIKNYALNRAVSDAYHTLLPIHRYPIVVLSLKMDPVLVDVNVHPTKLEVRFSKEKELTQLLNQAIKSVFKELTLIPELQKTSPQQGYVKEPTIQINANTYFDDTFHKSEPVLPDPYLSGATQKESVKQTNHHEVTEQVQVEEKQLEEQKERIPPLYPIGQLQGTYILAQNELGFYMIDQHAAQERIKYEYYRDKLSKTDNQLQELLIPLTFEFTQSELAFIKEEEKMLEDVGLFFEAFGHQTLAIRTVPIWFPEGEEENIIRDMVEQIIKQNKVSIKKIREEVAILMSCKRSIKANHYLDMTEMTRLLNDLRKAEDPFTCPHGRPVIVHFTTTEIEKMFKRIM